MLDVAIEAARAAGAILSERYRRPHKIKVKGRRDIVTEVDLEAEEAAMRAIRRGCPDGIIVSEESSNQLAADTERPIWYIDPLDGTTNYARALPMFSVSVAMAYGGVVQCGAVYDPLMDHLFSVRRGGGAFLNGECLRVSDRGDLGYCLVTLDWPRAQVERVLAATFLARLAPRVDAVRSRGSAALGFCYVAAGWVDAYFQYTLSPWDVAAGWLLVEEAGGQVTDLRGNMPRLDTPDWLVTNGLVHQQIVAMRPFAPGSLTR